MNTKTSVDYKEKNKRMTLIAEFENKKGTFIAESTFFNFYSIWFYFNTKVPFKPSSEFGPIQTSKSPGSIT